MRRNYSTLISALMAGTMALVAFGQNAGPTQLNAKEIEGLKFMREEEKLARDVYRVLGTSWGNPFLNIVSAEQNHMDSVKVLLDRYQIEDPALSEDGKFQNADLQKLYNRLVADGRKSRTSALEVGARVEELDLSDLEHWSKMTKNLDVTRVYENLARGSRNHLRSFVSVIKRSGGTYKPIHLSQKRFDEIVSSPMERGRGGWD